VVDSGHFWDSVNGVSWRDFDIAGTEVIASAEFLNDSSKEPGNLLPLRLCGSSIKPCTSCDTIFLLNLLAGCTLRTCSTCSPRYLTITRNTIFLKKLKRSDGSFESQPTSYRTLILARARIKYQVLHGLLHRLPALQ